MRHAATLAIGLLLWSCSGPGVLEPGQVGEGCSGASMFESELPGTVLVLGEVVHPGEVVTRGDLTLSAAIGAAGGPTVLGWTNFVRVERDCGQTRMSSRINLDAITAAEAPDVRLVRGDIVYVPLRE